MITQEKLKEALSYNPRTGIFTHRDSVTPHANSRWAGRIAGSKTAHGYVMLNIRGKPMFAHRAAWLYMTGKVPVADIDHRNGIRDDNSWDNLREATRKENLQNQRAASKNSISGYLGVSPKRGKFTARIMINRKVQRLGTFDTAEQAHTAYVKAKRKLHPSGTL